MLIVKAKVFSMDFWLIKSFVCDNIEFKRLDNYKKIRDLIRKERQHYQTGTVTVRIPHEISDPDKSIDYTISLLDKCSMLLSFAHNHDVFFNEYTCYEVTDEKTEPKRSCFASIVVGKATGPGPNIYSHGLERFISTTLPLIQNEDFNKETGISRAIVWYNEALDLGVIETKFLALWMALEIAANSYSEANPRDFLLLKEEWNQLMKEFDKLLKRIKITSKEAIDKLYGALGFARKGHIVDRIAYLLSGYELSQYNSEIPTFNKMRNDILHGRTLDYSSKPSSVDNAIKLERLLVKLVLTILNFQDKVNLIHSSILKDDLLARG